jgi:hypothetical protein
MKSQLYILTISISILLVSTISSCKKYTCECTAHNFNSPESGGHSDYTVRKKDKTKLCTDKSTQPDNLGNYTTCVVK